MTRSTLTRRLALLGGVAALPACATLSALERATGPLPTFDLLPAQGPIPGRRRNTTFMVAAPVAAAVLETDRWLLRPTPSSVTYVPDARWSETLPALIQSLVIRSLSATGRVGYVGPAGDGPIPDFAVLSRVDRFDISETRGAAGAPAYQIGIALNVTVLRDSNQKVVATRGFADTAPITSLDPPTIVAAYQSILTPLLAEMAGWIVATASR